MPVTDVCRINVKRMSVYVHIEKEVNANFCLKRIVVFGGNDKNYREFVLRICLQRCRQCLGNMIFGISLTDTGKWQRIVLGMGGGRRSTFPYDI